MEHVQLNNRQTFWDRNDSLFYIKMINSIKNHGEQ